MGKRAIPKGEDWEEALRGLSPALSALEAAEEIRRSLPPDQARKALEQRDLRRRAVGRLANAPNLILTRKGLEQATRERVARERASRISNRMPDALVFDATSGIGSDSLALAKSGLRFLVADLDPEHARCVRENLIRSELPAHVVIANANHPPVKADVIVIDPDRRDGSKRLSDPEKWSPSLSTCLRLADTVIGACIKLAPALDLERIPALPESLPHSWQWTSADGELVEVTLWTGELADANGERRILCLNNTFEPFHYTGTLEPDFHMSSTDAQDVDWISEPDPALIRSGLLTHFAHASGLAPIGPSIAYLGSKTRPTSSPLIKTWRVVDSSTTDRKRVRAMLREHDIGNLVVKKRGYPKTAAELVREFRGKGSSTGTLIVTRLEKGHRAYLVTSS
ncbi:MAG: hypothetical protein ACI87A_002315 [Planctomycetota bacterium]|jgi:hypothetical protein